MKNFDQLMNETNEIINKLNSSSVSMDESMKLFQVGIENLREAKKQLAENKATIQKVLEDNKIEEFE
jgi:exodeoxyribonuclease VII small subunit